MNSFFRLTPLLLQYHYDWGVCSSFYLFLPLVFPVLLLLLWFPRWWTWVLFPRGFVPDMRLLHCTWTQPPFLSVSCSYVGPLLQGQLNLKGRSLFFILPDLRMLRIHIHERWVSSLLHKGEATHIRDLGIRQWIIKHPYSYSLCLDFSQYDNKMFTNQNVLNIKHSAIFAKTSHS